MGTEISPSGYHYFLIQPEESQHGFESISEAAEWPNHQRCTRESPSCSDNHQWRIYTWLLQTSYVKSTTHRPGAQDRKRSPQAPLTSAKIKQQTHTKQEDEPEAHRSIMQTDSSARSSIISAHELQITCPIVVIHRQNNRQKARTANVSLPGPVSLVFIAIPSLNTTIQLPNGAHTKMQIVLCNASYRPEVATLQNLVKEIGNFLCQSSKSLLAPVRNKSYGRRPTFIKPLKWFQVSGFLLVKRPPNFADRQSNASSRILHCPTIRECGRQFSSDGTHADSTA